LVLTARVHEWAWGDVGRRTVCGLGAAARLHIVSDLGALDLERRCRNCARLRAAFGVSSKVLGAEPIAPSPALAEVAAAVAATVVVSEREREIMMHATGWQSRWPLFRNHFCTSPGGDDWAPIQRLIEVGLMRVSRKPSDLSGGDTVFSVTAIGVAALKGRGKANRTEQAG
jgi:hypothetical protein